ncbi:hypothetical protein ABG088_00825, partial [Hydrogenibacillus schlegelii]
MAQYQITVDDEILEGLFQRDGGVAKLVESVVNQIRSSPVSCVNCPLRRMKGQVTQAFTTCSMAGSVDFCCSFFHC